MEPLYDLARSYTENIRIGPNLWLKEPLFTVPSTPSRKRLSTTFLNHRLNSPLGVAAGPLLNSEWVKLASYLGYDVLTYKTIRSYAFEGHPPPNIRYVTPPVNGQSYVVDRPGEEVIVTNYFGMPSQSRDYLKEDIPKALSYLQEGQILLVSVTGTGNTLTEWLHDLVEVSCFVKELHVPIIEVNLSCPNVELNYPLVKWVREVGTCLHSINIPLIIKVGALDEELPQVLETATQNHIQAVCGINALKTQVHLADGSIQLSGVCGGGIRSQGLSFVRRARSVIMEKQLNLTLMGCGGIMKPNHIQEYLDNGADVALTATGLLYNPFLAHKYKR